MINMVSTLILVSAALANAVVIGHQEHVKPFSVSEMTERQLDSVVESLAEYLDRPMSWCEVTPTGFSGTKPVGGARYTGYVSINVELRIDCDNNAAMDKMEYVFGSVYQYDSKGKKPVGMMWDGYNGYNFTKKMQARYPGIRYIWNQGGTEVNMFIENAYAGVDQGSPVMGKLVANGITLTDDYVTDHRYGNEDKSADIFRIPVESSYIIRVAVESPKAPNAAQLNLDFRNVHSYEASVSYLMRVDKADKILSNKNIDVTVNRVYNHKTPGYMNRDYKFLGHLSYK